MATLQQVMAHVHGWPRSLHWNEFTRIQSSREPPHLSECAAGFRLVATPLIPQGNGATINRNFRIEVFVTKDPTPGDTGTWVVIGSQTDDLLKHEQGHYDLAGLAAREYARELLMLRDEGPLDPTLIRDRVKAMNDQIVSELALMNDAYDDPILGTDHGVSRIQDRWNIFIPGHLKTFLEPDISWIEDLTVILSG